MRNFFFVFLLTILFLDFTVVCQTTGNIPLHCKTKFGREKGSGDVWGLQIDGTNYALVTLDGGLSIVNTDNLSNPSETAHINHVDHAAGSRLGMPDVETFTKNGTTYAYLATGVRANTGNTLVIIINVNKAIEDMGLILIDPDNDPGVPDEVFAGKIDIFGNINKSHTLTIAGGYLYVATLNQYLPVWDLNQNPTSPHYIGAITINTPETAVHEMSVRPLNALRANIYAACVIGGLQVIDIQYTPTKGSPPTGFTLNSTTEHLYEFDRAYPNTRGSEDLLFDFRITHSAWPTDDEDYIFTTDELGLDSSDPPPTTQYSGGDPNLYNDPDELRTPRREGAFLRTWLTDDLGTDDSFKGGFYVSEDYYQGITDLTIIDTNWVPNSIHQMHSNGDFLYVSHYTQGFRMLDMSDPENLIEIGYYDDFPLIDFNPSSDLFFRKEGNWHKGIFGVFPDQNRPEVCYAGGSDGFYIFNVTTPPFTATDLEVTVDGGFAVLNWTASVGPDLDKYKIYRKSTPASEEPLTFSLVTTINAFNGGGPVTTWTDINPAVGSGSWHLNYAISAVDDAGSESVLSNYDWVPWDLNWQKRGEEISSVTYEYKLHNNYPNPFNPNTTINYSIKKDGLVLLNVYDVLGTQVIMLVNENKPEGSHTVEFNAATLSSGIYFYKLTSGNYTSIKKLILMK